jgi:hypothetical protein
MRAMEIGAVLLATVARPAAYAFFPHPTWQYSISQMTVELPRHIGMSALLIILLADSRFVCCMARPMSRCEAFQRWWRHTGFTT